MRKRKSIDLNQDIIDKSTTDQNYNEQYTYLKILVQQYESEIIGILPNLNDTMSFCLYEENHECPDPIKKCIKDTKIYCFQLKKAIECFKEGITTLQMLRNNDKMFDLMCSEEGSLNQMSNSISLVDTNVKDILQYADKIILNTSAITRHVHHSTKLKIRALEECYIK